MSSINVGIIGYGHTGRIFHLPYILTNPDFHLSAFLQRHDRPFVRGKVGTHCQDDFPETKWYRTKEEFMADDKIDLAVVLTGHESHAELAGAALLAGKHGRFALKG